MRRGKTEKRGSGFKRKVFLFISALALFSLFLTHSIWSVILAILLLVLFLAALIALPEDGDPLGIQVHPFIFLCTTALETFGLYCFYSEWKSSATIERLAAALHSPRSILILAFGVSCCLLGFFAAYISFSFLFARAAGMIKFQDFSAARLKDNWYLPASSFAFFKLVCHSSEYYRASTYIAVLAAVLVAMRVPSISKEAAKEKTALKFFSFFTALGICLYARPAFQNYSMQSSLMEFWRDTIAKDLTYGFSLLMMIAALPFVFICVLYFWHVIIKLMKQARIFDGVTIPELVFYAILLEITLLVVTVVFMRTNAFYGGKHYNIVYTSDSHMIVVRNAYMTLLHEENYVHQPLFAVFSAPFFGCAYLLSFLRPSSFLLKVLILNDIQVILLFFSNYMLAKIMQLTAVKRVCFMAVICSSYTYMLFALMMEQYIVGYFWLILLLLVLCNREGHAGFVLFAASGTLLTSAAFSLFVPKESPFKNFKKWFGDMVCLGLGFLGTLLAFGRFDALCTAVEQIKHLISYTGKNISTWDKIKQYLAFLYDCFFAPASQVITGDFSAWHLSPVTRVNYVGLAILILAVLGFVVNYKKKSSAYVAFWVLFSVAILCVVGWGTAENGMNLYSLYFGWAYLVLIFQLIEKAESKLEVKYLVPIFTMVSVLVLLSINIPAMGALIRFGAEYYPA